MKPFYLRIPWAIGSSLFLYLYKSMTIQHGVLILFLISLSIYTFTSLNTLFHMPLVSGIYLGVSLLINFLLLYFTTNQNLREAVELNPNLAILLSCLIGIVFAQILWAVVIAVDDLRGLLTYAVRKGRYFFSNRQATPAEGEIHFSRALFLQWLGFGIASFVYGSLAWGIGNRYNYKIRKEKLSLEGLSEAWKGLTIVQLSDIHCGSFSNRNAVEQGIRMVNEARPDIILFTGDLVNNRSRELEKWKDLFSTLHAPMGIFSVLGNHDYGDYVSWESPREKQDNLTRLKAMQKEMGWRLLLNENVLLKKVGATDAIALIGVENWSVRFTRYGKLEQAYKGCEKIPVKILLSHDPSHWNAEVRTKFTDINLMLAGHTHGMQFGLETPFFKWSPVQWVYEQWAGMHQEGKQQLYVNRGFGYIGYTGRVGIMPEITVFELT